MYFSYACACIYLILKALVCCFSVLLPTRVNRFLLQLMRSGGVIWQQNPARAHISTSRVLKRKVNDGDVDFEPLTGGTLPRYADLATLMRLPHLPLKDLDASNIVDIGLIGIPWDGGTTNRPGARMGPRAVRDISTVIRNVNRATGVNPFSLCNCADLGDSPVNPLNVIDALKRITGFYKEVVDKEISPLSVGGDHLVSLPVLRAVAPQYSEPLGLIHFDAHSDTWDSYFGDENKFSHGTGFRRAIEEGLIDPQKTIQIGLRGALYADALDDWAVEQGVTQIDIDAFQEMGVEGVLTKVAEVVGRAPCYVSFDIDVLDPAFACGTGTPEIGGMTTREAQQLVRGLAGMDIVGGDLVEVAPAYDPTSNTALAGATILYEMLCVLTQSISSKKLVKRFKQSPGDDKSDSLPG